MHANILPLFFKPASGGDWTQQELAEFYRVETILLQSGISLETDRGVSDEGDPWFVFCRPEIGDVVIHFARHGNEYIAAGGGLDRVLRGRSFRDIVDAFVTQQPLMMKRPANDTKVFLHPAALLSALVATAFFLFMGSDAEAADAHEAASKTPTKDSLPATFQALLEAAGLIGNREAWIALSAVTVALSVTIFEFGDHVATASEASLVTAGMDAQRGEHELVGAMLNESEFARPDERGVKSADAANFSADANADAQDQETHVLHAAAQAVTAPAESVEHTFTTNAFSGDQAVILAKSDDAQIAPSFDDASDLLEHARLQAAKAEENVARHAEENQAMQVVQDSISAQVAHHTSIEVLSPSMMTALTNVMQADFYQTGAFAAVVTAIDSEGAHAAQNSVFARATDDLESTAVRGTIFEEHESVETAFEALEWFAASNPDYKVVSLGRNVIVFDWSDLASGKQLHVHTWSMDDGSTVNIIGALPDFEALSA